MPAVGTKNMQPVESAAAGTRERAAMLAKLDCSSSQVIRAVFDRVDARITPTPTRPHRGGGVQMGVPTQALPLDGLCP
jgi:hypothetical protein